MLKREEDEFNRAQAKIMEALSCFKDQQIVIDKFNTGFDELK